jgi:hypothetical protein
VSRTPHGSQSLADDVNDENQSVPEELSWFAKKRYSDISNKLTMFAPSTRGVVRSVYISSVHLHEIHSRAKLRDAGTM